MPTSTTLQAIGAYWTAYFACQDADLDSPVTLVVPHAAMRGYAGLFLFRRDRSCLVSAPPERIDAVHTLLHGRKPEEFFADTFWRSALGEHFERTVGPAWLGYADRSDFQPVSAEDVRLLDAGDRTVFQQLADACPPTEWEPCGLEFERPPIFGRFVGGELAAAAGYDRWGARLAHIRVVTHPAHRGQGHGRSVVSASARHALDLGLIPQYRTLVSNTPSLAIGHTLGFQEYARTLAVRIGGVGP